MEIKHPYHGLTKRLEVDAEIKAYLDGLVEPKQTPMKERLKTYWRDQKVGVPGGEPGVVPAGEYTDPGTEEAKAALAGLYQHLRGRPVSRHLVAVALNFQVADDVDKVLDKLAADGRVGTEILPGDKGKSRRWIGEGADYVAPAKAKKSTAKAAPETPAPEPEPKPEYPKGSRAAKRAAAKLAAEHGESVAS